AQQLGIATKPAESVPQAFFDPTTGTAADPTPFLTTYGLTDTALLSAGFAINTLGEPDQSALQVITEAGLQNAPYINLVEQLLIGVIGGPAGAQSVEDLFNFLQFSPGPFVFPGNDSLYVLNGYGAFVARLATGLPIQLQSPVQSITYGGSLVTLTTTGQTYQARTVIVTASIGVLASGAIAFSPALPPAYVAALAGLPMAHAYKIMLGFTRNPFNGRLGTQPGKQNNIVPLVDAPTPTFLVNYFAEEYPNAGTFMIAIVEGPDADTYEAMGPTNAAQAILQRAEVPFPGVTAAWNGQALASSWATNPYTRGCYTFATPGHAAARVQLAQPLSKQVWFAGEALSIRAHSLVHGAWESGIAAAYGALASLGVL